MFPDVIAVQYVGDYELKLTFADGICGCIDFAPWIMGKGGVFTLLEDKGYFARVKVNEEIGTIVWPNDVDFDPEVLYARLTNRQIPEPASTLAERQRVSMD